jgi:chromosome segregation ATPase
MEKVTFTVEELKNIPEDVLNKLLAYTAQAEQEIQKAKDRKDQAITAYNELEEAYTLQKTLVRDQDTKIKSLENEFITIKDHNQIFNGLKAHYEQLLLEQKAETKRVDDLLFAQEEDNKKYRKETKELNEDLKTARKAANHWKDAHKKSQATGDLLARKLIEAGWTPKRKQKTVRKTTVNIQNYFNVNNPTQTIEDQVEQVIEAAAHSISSGNEIVVDRAGLYSPKRG